MAGIPDELEILRPDLEWLSKQGGGYALSQVHLVAPIPRPGKILALGLNYRDHAADVNMALPEHQTWFEKMSTATNGPFDPIHLPRVSTRLDYEAELAVVIGRRARHVARAQAPAVIAGYRAANDVSVRDCGRCGACRDRRYRRHREPGGYRGRPVARNPFEGVTP